MRGCSQSQLLRCSNGEYYVVKFPNNPQGARILANELLGTLLARKLGLPVPEPALVSVPYELIRHSKDMAIQLDHGHVPCRAGLCFGSRFPRDENLHSQLAQPIEFVPSNLISKVDNISDFAGMLVFDKWAANADDRQVALVRRAVGGSYRVLMIDQGFCFGGPRWDFGVGAKYGVYVLTPSVYSNIERLSDFDPWLERLDRQVNRGFLEWAVQQIPPEWHQNDHSSVARLIDTLDARRSRVPELLLSTRDAYPALFPAWVRSVSRARHLAESVLGCVPYCKEKILRTQGNVPDVPS
ncbi:MAG: HipA family kinase [Candidatus Acidiferrales bacterium]